MTGASKTGSTEFNAKAWKSEVTRLNPWMKGFKPDDDAVFFDGIRKEACLARYAHGREAWNEWAATMLASKSELEQAGQWSAEGYKPSLDSEGHTEGGEYKEMRTWLAAARSDFTGHTFSEGADFGSFDFPSIAVFGRIREQQNAQPTRFHSEAVFDGAQFSGTAVFNDTQFPQYTSFCGAQFSGKAWFSAARFHGAALFDNAQFSRIAWFYKAQFSVSANFSKVQFSEDAQFSEAQFSGDAGFGEAEFSGNAQFGKAQFSEYAWFDDAQFSGDAAFGEAQFSGNALFNTAQFSGNAWFNAAQFSGDAAFGRAQFSGDAVFKRANFQSAGYFDDATFAGVADFVAIRGERDFSLAGARFDLVPDFIQANFAEAPRFDFMSLAPNVEPGRLWRSVRGIIKPDIESARNLSARYRALKRLAIQGHDHEREQMFFKGELRARRGGVDSAGSWRLWLGLLYQLLSDFGRSVIRPFLWWGVTTGGFAWFYLVKHFTAHDPAYPTGVAGWLWMALKGWAANVLGALPRPGWLAAYLPQFTVPELPNLTCLAGNDGAPLVAAMLLAVKKGLLVFGFVASDKINQTYACLYGTTPSDKPNIPDEVAFAGIGQTLISAVLIFLVLLAIRNHFRIR